MQHTDVIIIGAGLSGIGAACHLRMTAPSRDFILLEGRERFGGTWDLFKYPGIRSDSDMFTFGYSFRPWTEGKDIASASSILNYLKETIDEYDLSDKINYGHKVMAADWSSADKKWILKVEGPDGEKTFSCNFLIGASGYYNYEHGYTPDFAGMDDFKGQIIHPQQWPDDLDYAGKTVLVIGSGATAVTLVPSMAEAAEHVTMLQRSPTYVFTRPAEDKVAKGLRKVLPGRLAYRLTRVKNVLLSTYMYTQARKHPDKTKAFLAEMAEKELDGAVPVDPHFKPNYDPWDERLCLVPDADLFNVLKDGSASIVTDEVERFTKNGVRTKSGQEIEADIIIPATGLELQFFGGMQVAVDGREIKPAEMVSYKGMMFGNLPNLAAIFGYTNATWTLKADLTGNYLARLLNLMEKRRVKTVVPRLPEQMEAAPLVNLKSGYFKRGLPHLPKQGSEAPWCNRENYIRDYFAIRWGKIEDGVLGFEA